MERLYGTVPSMRRRGNARDNSVVEDLFKRRKGSAYVRSVNATCVWARADLDGCRHNDLTEW